MRIPPDMDPKVFTLTAIIIGYLLLDELTYNEQNAMGNWFILIGQIFETTSAQGYVMEERGEEAKQSSEDNPPFPSSSNSTNSMNSIYNVKFASDQELLLIKKTLEKMQRQINELLRNNNML